MRPAILIAAHPCRFLRRALESFVEISHLNWLKSSVGKDLTDGEARELFMISRRESFRRGDFVFNEGEEANALFLVAHGEVDIRKKLNDGSLHSLAVHPDGAVVGEMSLLTREIRSASAVVTSSEAILLRITAHDLDELLNREPTTAYKLMYALARVLAHGATLVHAPITTPWGDYNARVMSPDGLQITLFQPPE